jgi:hypothetical protein
MRFEHIPNTKIKARFSDDRNFRYCLEIINDNNSPNANRTVCVIMQNPSVADDKVADKSVQFLEKFIFGDNDYSQFNGINRIIIVNQFAYVKTNDFNGSKEHIGEDNDLYIRNAIEKADIILIAWGVSNVYKNRQEHIITKIKDLGKKEVYATKKHPSRGRYNDFIYKYSI